MKCSPLPCAPASASSLYPGDLTDSEWPQLSPLLPCPARRGRIRRWALRLLVNALFYVLRTGCARKRHLLVDTLGLLLAVYVTPADTPDQEGARRLLVGLKPLQPGWSSSGLTVPIAARR